MTREELEAAVKRIDGGIETKAHWLTVLAAALKQLALMPEKCEHGLTRPHGRLTDEPLSDNWCPGKVYPPETVEKIARTIYEADMSSLTIIDGVPVPNDDWDGLIEVVKNNYRRMAVAVLDALGETPKPPPGDTLPWFEDWNSEEDSVYDEMGQ